MKPLIYIAGPLSRGWMITNVRNAVTAAAGMCRAHDVIPYVPHAHEVAWETIEPMGDPFWLAHGLEMVRRCDGLYRLPGGSSGSDAEVEEACRCMIPVWLVGDPGSLGLWWADPDDPESMVQLHRFADWIHAVRHGVLP